jgi:hypothetical protein
MRSMRLNGADAPSAALTGEAGVRLRKGKPDAGSIAAEDLNASNDE